MTPLPLWASLVPFSAMLVSRGKVSAPQGPGHPPTSFHAMTAELWGKGAVSHLSLRGSSSAASGQAQNLLSFESVFLNKFSYQVWQNCLLIIDLGKLTLGCMCDGVAVLAKAITIPTHLPKDIK